MARGFLRVALLALVLCLAVEGGYASPVTKSEIGLSAGATRKLLAAHQYRMRERVPLYANKAGPFHNPSEVRRGSATPAKPVPEIVVDEVDVAGVSRPERAKATNRLSFHGLVSHGDPAPETIADHPRASPSTRHRYVGAPLFPSLDRLAATD